MIKYDLSNEDYHGDKTCFSSTQLKTVLESPEMFYQQYILGRSKKMDSPALRIGNAVHTRILEPDKFDDEYAIYKGKIRRGAQWEQFKAENEGKILLTDKDMVQVDVAVDNILNTDATLPYINGGTPEVSLFTELEGVKIKVRADYLNEKLKYIQDIKTTGEIVNEVSTRRKIAQFGYDLSAALYLDAFRQEGFDIESFIWVFSSKSYQSCKVFKASEQMLENGRIKYKRALDTIKRYQDKNWDLTNDVVELSPIEWDVQSENVVDTEEEMW